MTKVLVVEDDKDIRDLVGMTLRMEGYEPLLASDGEEGLRLASREMPHLILLDVMLPHMDGFEVCRRLRESVLTASIPIIMLTAKGRVSDKLTGFGLGVDDYVTKPFDTNELIARVHTQLRHLEHTLLSELTGLPGNRAIERAIGRIVGDPTLKWAVLYIDIDNFKAYNDVYGFMKGNELITATARTIQQVVSEFTPERETPSDLHFVGHIGGDDFVVITTPEAAEPISKEIIGRFDAEVPKHYDPEDRSRGYISTVNRRGQLINYPLATLSIGIVTNQYRNFQNSLEVSKIASEVKHKAKEMAGSSYCFDLRR
ncbi:MAG: response regulator [Chloroflexi bacterium]|nr:response regulator [Chloroflexota bacterium]